MQMNQMTVEFCTSITDGWYIYADQSETTDECGGGEAKERRQAL